MFYTDEPTRDYDNYNSYMKSSMLDDINLKIEKLEEDMIFEDDEEKLIEMENELEELNEERKELLEELREY